MDFRHIALGGPTAVGKCALAERPAADDLLKQIEGMDGCAPRTAV